MNNIEIRNLTKRYNDFTLDNISFNVPKGCIVGLVGENGAGKTTTINAILDIIKYDGEIILFNNEINALDIKENIGAVLDEAFFPSTLKGKEILNILKSTYKNFDKEYFLSLIKKFDLPLNKEFSKFSRGMKMKLQIASALSHSPNLLILDEATSGLDPLMRNEILDLLNEYTRNAEKSILISSHIVSDLEKVCDYIAFINKGKLVLFNEKDELLETYGILKISNDDIENIDESSIIKKKKTGFGYEALVLKDSIPNIYKTEYTNLEDIIIFLGDK